MTPSHASETLSFGPFTLAPGERRLTRDGAPVPLGDRSLDILAALLSRPNEVVTKRELFARVWPGGGGRRRRPAIPHCEPAQGAG